ncbi:MAG: FitA-like ribbon-helix-helix domain-containing protein [Spirochaetia bacterium]
MKMIQIRNVPDDIHRTLKSRAALAGLSLLAGIPKLDVQIIAVK